MYVYAQSVHGVYFLYILFTECICVRATPRTHSRHCATNKNTHTLMHGIPAETLSNFTRMVHVSMLAEMLISWCMYVCLFGWAGQV